ncbi:PREDICTED: centromere protein Q-like [Cariama cristata]|uniref:centromere protein Q-like n=1 Tax=Cariama cristata TaxID=54380 RepID=UPI00052056D5|nr:PREDICTED: centromere protein Q-like [Cariama cristata]
MRTEPPGAPPSSQEAGTGSAYAPAPECAGKTQRGAGSMGGEDYNSQHTFRRWACATVVGQRCMPGVVVRASHAEIIKHPHTSSSKMGETAGGRSAKKQFKSQNQQGLSSKKKGTDGEGRNQGQKRKQVSQTVKRKAKEPRDYSPAEEKVSSKKVKLTSAKIGSWQTLPESSRQFLETVMDSVILSVLCQQSQRKDDVQKHLNLLKER